MFKFLLIAAALGIAQASVGNKRCDSDSPTTASGPRAPADFCPGDLIFQDEFDFLDFDKWTHENTFSGGGVSTYKAL